MKNYFDKQFELRYFEMNKLGEASPTAILTLLEETAADHSFAINHSLYDLEKQNIGWVLLSGIMEMDYYPRYKEKITIRTWLSNYSTIKGYRENIIYNEQGRVIGKAKGLWVFFDISRRRPIQIPEEIKGKWSFFEEESIKNEITSKIKVLDSSEHIKEFKINRYDVDTNLHVNNIRYLQWLIESIPEDIINHYYLHSIDGRFVSEAQLGDTIMSYSEIDSTENTFIHNIKTAVNNKVCATARTIWKPRKN